MSTRPLTVIPWLIALVSAGLLAYAGFTAWDRARVPAVHAEVPDLTLANAKTGPNTIAYVVVNDGPGSVRLVGGERQCCTNCCIQPRFKDLPTIPPGGSVVVPYEVSVGESSEPFAAEFNLFLLWRTKIVPLKLTVSGAATGNAVPEPETPGRTSMSMAASTCRCS